MSRIVVRGGRIFDGTGADPADGDVAIEDGRIVDIGAGLDGDEAVDIDGRTLRNPPPNSTATPSTFSTQGRFLS